MDDFTQKLILLIVGWALGLFTPIAKSWFDSKKRKAKIKNGIRAEFDDLGQRLALAASMIDIQSLGITKEILRYARDRVKPEFFPSSMKPFIDISERLLQVDDDEFKKVAATVQSSRPDGLSLKKYNIPYTTTKFSDLSEFSESLQQRILQVNTHLDLLNQHVEDSVFYRGLTFSNLDEENHCTAREEQNRCRQLVASQCKTIVELVEALRPLLK